MKNILLFGLVLLLMPLPRAHATKTRYSSDWVSISGPEVQKRVKAAANRANATELYSLWSQARTQKQHWIYAVALRDIVQQQPQNAPALATYSLVLLEIMREYSRAKNFERARKIYFGDDLTFKGVRARIEQAKKLDSKQWPIWVTESQIVPFPDGTTHDGTMEEWGIRSETFARRAIALENNSFTNSALAYAINSRTSWESKPLFVNRAIIAASRASRMEPVSVQARAFLLGLYRDYKKNPTKVREVKKDILSTVPPNLRLSDAAKAYLRQLEIF